MNWNAFAFLDSLDFPMKLRPQIFYHKISAYWSRQFSSNNRKKNLKWKAISTQKKLFFMTRMRLHKKRCLSRTRISSIYGRKEFYGCLVRLFYNFFYSIDELWEIPIFFINVSLVAIEFLDLFKFSIVIFSMKLFNFLPLFD